MVFLSYNKVPLVHDVRPMLVPPMLIMTLWHLPGESNDWQNLSFPLLAQVTQP